MGCASSKATAASSFSTIQQDILQNQMAALAAVQQQHVSKQQQMMQDDPECKHLMEKQLDIQRRTMEAMASGDANASLQAQNDMMELMKNPKMMKMMMPDISLLNTGLRTTTTSMNTSSGNGGVAAPHQALSSEFLQTQVVSTQQPFHSNIVVGGPVIQAKGF